tara:strand:- start:376 stop:1383 length:1008 start_codon:yes stop_codon:yes gene_type:complete
MGGACQSTTTTLPTSSSTLSGTEIPEWVSAGGRILFDQAMELAKSPYPEYSGARIASYTDPETGEVSKMTPEEQQAMGILRDDSGSYQTYLDSGYEAAQGLGQGYDKQSYDTLMGSDFNLESAQPFLDIYQGAADAGVREAERQTRLGQNDARAAAARAGAFGGSRLGVQEALLGSEGAMVAGDLRAKAAAEGLGFAASRFDSDRAGRMAAEDRQRQGYETEEASRVREAEALQSYAPMVQGLQEQAAAGLLGAGEARRKLDQTALDLAFTDYTEQAQYPYQQLNFALGALKGVPYEQRQFSLAQGEQTAQAPSIYGQTIGGLGSLASAYYMGNR